MWGRLTDEQKRSGFGYALRTFRKMRGYSQTKLAERSKVSQPMISKYEKGDAWPSMSHFIKLCEGLALAPSTVLLRAGL